MEKQIIITPRFSRQAEKLHNYLLDEWSAKIAFEFMEKLWNKLNSISRYPETGKQSKRNNTIRSVILRPHNKIYYKVTENNIYFLLLFDMRQHPAKNLYQ